MWRWWPKFQSFASNNVYESLAREYWFSHDTWNQLEIRFRFEFQGSERSVFNDTGAGFVPSCRTSAPSNHRPNSMSQRTNELISGLMNEIGVPDPPNNCSISNQTSSSFEIDCSEGYDGGIPQHFKMHVFDMKTRVLLANLTSSSPKFALHVGGQTSNAVGPMDSQRPHYGPDETPRTHSWKSNTVGGEITWVGTI